jgi:microsomal dipeptidase-like Zn-dependent dipeptidase
MLIIDALQYVNWNRELFTEARNGGVSAIHVTISYWENTESTLANIGDWRRRFRDHSDLIMPVRTAEDIRIAETLNKVGIILGFQNCSPIEDDLRKVEMLHEQGVRIMQLSYNNQSLLATGCYENDDSGVTRFGREVIKEMNRVGMVIDMSHSAEKSTLQAIDYSERPIAITHANPSQWHHALRNKSNDVLKALGESRGMLGFSMYPFHLNNNSSCTLDDFCGMILDTAELMGIDNIGIGSDLCQNWSYDTLEWMRSGTWTFKPDFGEGSSENPDWPEQPEWFKSSGDFGNISQGLISKGMSNSDVEKIMGLNWLNFFDRSFEAIKNV